MISKYYLKKRYRVLASLSIFSHILGVLSVLYMLIFDIELWLSSMKNSRFYIGLKDHDHDPYIILKTWIIGIQVRYILTDCWVFYNSIKDVNLLKFTIKTHGLDGLICSVIFFSHSSSRDCVIFGIVCLLWTLMWVVAYFLLINKSIKKHNYLHHF